MYVAIGGGVGLCCCIVVAVVIIVLVVAFGKSYVANALSQETLSKSFYYNRRDGLTVYGSKYSEWASLNIDTHTDRFDDKNWLIVRWEVKAETLGEESNKNAITTWAIFPDMEGGIMTGVACVMPFNDLIYKDIVIYDNADGYVGDHLDDILWVKTSTKQDPDWYELNLDELNLE